MISSVPNPTNQVLIAWAKEDTPKQVAQPTFILKTTPEQFQQRKLQNSLNFSRLNAKVENIGEEVKTIKKLMSKEQLLRNNCANYPITSKPARIALKVLLTVAVISLIVCTVSFFNPATVVIGAIGFVPIAIVLSMLIALQIEIAVSDSERKRLDEVNSELQALKSDVEEKIGNIDHLLTVEDKNLHAELRKTPQIAQVITVLNTEKSHIDAYEKIQAILGD